MKKHIVISIVLMMFAANMSAQRLDGQVIAKLMDEELEYGRFSNSPYTDYLDSIGFTDDSQGRDEILFYSSKDVSIKITTRLSDDSASRMIGIKCKEHNIWWQLILDLQKYGFKVTDGEYPYADISCESLKGATGLESITLFYSRREMTPGIDMEFPGEKPSQEQIDEWREKYDAQLRAYTDTIPSRYHVGSKMIGNHPGLVYLILQSRTLNTHVKVQEWFDIFPKMKEEAIYKLYRILLTEQYKLAKIEEKYQKKQEEILQHNQ